VPERTPAIFSLAALRAGIIIVLLLGNFETMFEEGRKRQTLLKGLKRGR
jgi:hypothetical protein